MMDALKDSAMLQKAQHIWSMLDDLAEKNPESYKNFITKQLNEGREYAKPPEPHMCVQTTLLSDSRLGVKKFYVNFFSWHRVPAPADDSAPIPVAGTKLFQENGGDQYVAVAFNDKVLELYGTQCRNLEEQQMLINLAFDYVEDQNKIKLSRTYTIQPSDCPFYGNKQQLISGLTQRTKSNGESNKESSLPLTNPAELLSRLSMENASGDQEGMDMTLPSLLNSNKSTKPVSTSTPVLIEEMSASSKGTTKPEHSLTVTRSESDSDSSNIITLTIRLPGISSVSECELDISPMDAHLVVPDRYELNVTFPHKVDADRAKAKFSRKTNALTVTVPTSR